MRGLYYSLHSLLGYGLIVQTGELIDGPRSALSGVVNTSASIITEGNFLCMCISYRNWKAFNHFTSILR